MGIQVIPNLAEQSMRPELRIVRRAESIVSLNVAEVYPGSSEEYYEDKLGARPLLLHFAGSTGAADEGSEGFARSLEDPELDIVDLAPRPLTGAVTPLGTASVASVTGALAGVR